MSRPVIPDVTLAYADPAILPMLGGDGEARALVLHIAEAQQWEN